MDVREIPRMLFQEFTAENDGQKGCTTGGLDVVLRESDRSVGLFVFGRNSYEFSGPDFGLDYAFKVIAGPVTTGTWAFSWGNKVIESLSIASNMRTTLYIYNPTDEVIGLQAELFSQVLRRINEILEEGNVEMTEYWSEKNRPPQL